MIFFYTHRLAPKKPIVIERLPLPADGIMDRDSQPNIRQTSGNFKDEMK